MMSGRRIGPRIDSYEGCARSGEGSAVLELAANLGATYAARLEAALQVGALVASSFPIPRTAEAYDTQSRLAKRFVLNPESMMGAEWYPPAH